MRRLGLVTQRWVGLRPGLRQQPASRLLGLRFFSIASGGQTAMSAEELVRLGKNKVHFRSLGCARNLVDTEVMLGTMLRAGYVHTHDASDADVVVVNTCGFLLSARDESKDTIREFLDVRKPESKLVVTGCMVNLYRNELEEAFGTKVDHLLGSGAVDKILQVLTKAEVKSTSRSFLAAGEVPRQVATPQHYAYLKVAEGCRKRCAFCVIPKIKGPLRSKSIEQCERELGTLLRDGAREIILIAQDLGDWGKERRNGKQLLELLSALLDSTAQQFWLRLLYLYPDEITDELIAVIKSDPRICRYVDLPLQHINDVLLKSMKRKTSKQDILDTLAKLRSSMPDMVIRATLMVGFPGETEEQFEELMGFVRDFKLDHVGVFKYSDEPLAASFKLENKVPEEVKERRYAALMQNQYDNVVVPALEAMVGKELDVVIDSVHEPTSEGEDRILFARHQGQCPEVDSGVVIDAVGPEVEEVSVGALHRVEITGFDGYDLVGTVLRKL